MTAEKKEYVIQLANRGLDVEILKKIRLELLNGKTIDEIEHTYFDEGGKLTIPETEKEKPKIKIASNTTCEEKKTKEIMEEPYSDKMNPNQRARAEPEEEKNLQEAELQEQSKEQKLTDKNMAYSESVVFEEPNTPAPTEKEDSISVQAKKKESQDRMAEEIKTLKEEITNVKEKNQQIEDSIEKWKREVLEMQKTGKDVVAVPKPPKRKWFCFWPAKRTSDNYIIRLLSNPKFTTEQIMEIRLAVEADLDEMQIKSFAKAEVAARQMREIRLLYETQNKKRKGKE